MKCEGLSPGPQAPHKKLAVGVHAPLRAGETEARRSLELTSGVELASSGFSERPVSKYKAKGASKTFAVQAW